MSSKNPDKSLQRSESHLFTSTAKGNKPQAAQAIDEDEAFFEAGEFGDSNPVALQRTVWWFLSLHFGFRARDESRKLRWGDVQLQQQNDGQEVLVWLAERGTKTRHGQERGHQRMFQRKFNQRFLPPIPQSPASGNEGTRITGIIDDQMKKFGIRRHPTEKMK